MTHAQIKELAGGKAIPPWIMNLVSKAIAIEREACAKIADEYVGQDLEHNFSALVAHNIRARAEKHT